MDYAIVKTGGKQYRVSPGDVVDVELLSAEEGSTTEINDVLAVSRDGEVEFGKPFVDGARVVAQVQTHYKDRKIIVFKYKAKTRYRRKRGHRQNYTRILIQDIEIGGQA
ncbi:50S ribosomal protein L21 [Geodia barretti]|uniref:Large ribosomal subunit protein bL21m n=1 Tax=Geodia barretti TaxID=519541 RepID=A0AA35RHY5_GEOBA|nr:50S ribosomal protein L21 [Geodia barretti]